MNARLENVIAAMVAAMMIVTLVVCMVSWLTYDNRGTLRCGYRDGSQIVIHVDPGTPSCPNGGMYLAR